MEKIRAFERTSLHRYRRQRFWQIIFPILIFSLLIGVAGVITVFSSASSDRLLADISIIWLVIPVLVFSLIILALLVGLVYGMSKLISITPGYTRRAQDYFSRVEVGTRKIADSSMKPVLWLQKLNTKVKEFLDNLKGITKDWSDHG